LNQKSPDDESRNGSTDAIFNAIFYAMTAKLSLDKAGRIIIPKAIREKLHLSAGTALQAEVVGDRIEITQIPSEIRLEKRGKRRVVVGTGPFDAVAAVAEAREDYLSRLDPHRAK